MNDIDTRPKMETTISYNARFKNTSTRDIVIFWTIPEVMENYILMQMK